MLDSPALIELMNIMKKGQYLDLQYVPSLSHHPLFLENHLPQAVKFEQELLERVENKEHSIYEFCLSPKYYANRLGLTAETMLLAKLCLYEQPVERSEVESLLPQCLGVLDELCELTDDGKLHFPLRIVPIAQLLVVADRHDKASNDKIHFHKDSGMFATYLRNRIDLSACIGEIGVGSGAVSLSVAGAGAKNVHGVDINSRAIEFSQWNAKFNGLDQSVNFSLGSDADLIARPEIDVVISNPPSEFQEPEDTAICWDGGETYGLEIALRIVKECSNKGKKLFLIVFAPIANTENKFEALLPDSAKIIDKRCLYGMKLNAEYPNHRRYIQSGITDRELNCYEFE